MNSVVSQRLNLPERNRINLCERHSCSRFVRIVRKFEMTKVTGTKLKDTFRNILKHLSVIVCALNVQMNFMEKKIGI